MGKILVVDGDFATRMQAIRVLMGAGYEVAIAEDTIQAGIAALEHPDLVILGDSMATASGFALVTGTVQHSTIDRLVRAADQAMYRAKLAGGDQVITIS